VAVRDSVVRRHFGKNLGRRLECDQRALDEYIAADPNAPAMEPM
jgi:hypothetical protein